MADVTQSNKGSGIPPTAPVSYRLAAYLAAMLPPAAVAPVARIAGRVHYHFAAGKRGARRHNFAQVSEKNGNSRPWRAFQTHCLNILELLRALSQTSAATDRVHLEGAEHIDSALQQGRGLILTTLHTGNWELSGLSLAASGYALTTVAGEQLRAGWSDELKRFKERCGIRTVTPSDNMRALHRDLASNRVLVLHLDGNIHDGGVEATLLGRPVRMPRGPAALARVARTPVAFAFSRRVGNDELEVVIEEPVSPPATREEERGLVLRLARRMEKCIVEAPDEWCIFRKM